MNLGTVIVSPASVFWAMNPNLVPPFVSVMLASVTGLIVVAIT